MQVVLFVLSALYSGVWYLRWAIGGAKKRMWPLLGWFSGLMCLGSVAGAVAYGASMQSGYFTVESSIPGVEYQKSLTLSASAAQWNAIYYIMYPLEFLCMIIPKLMTLGRLTNIATRSLQAHAQEQSMERAWVGRGALSRVNRGIAAAVVLCSVLGMIAHEAAGVFELQIAGLLDKSAAVCDSQGNTTNCRTLVNQADAVTLRHLGTTLCMQSVLEAVALLLISTAYIVTVPLSVAIFRRAERDGANALANVAAHAKAGVRRTDVAAAIVDDTIQAAADQRRRLVMACVVVLTTFPVRAAFDMFSAYSLFYESQNPACRLCEPCQSDRFLIYVWISFTPELQSVVVALSSPLPLFVSLWIITGAHAQSYAITLNIVRERFGRRAPSQPLTDVSRMRLIPERGEVL